MIIWTSSSLLSLDFTVKINPKRPKVALNTFALDAHGDCTAASPRSQMQPLLSSHPATAAAAAAAAAARVADGRTSRESAAEKEWEWNMSFWAARKWFQGACDPGAFKLDHLQPVKLILFQKISNFLLFILGGPISYYPRERKEGKWGKGKHPKVNETLGFQTLGHSNWTTCSLLSWFCSKMFPLFYLSYWEVQFLITPERGRKEAAGAEIGKMGITQKWMRHRGFSTWGIQIGPFAAW